MKTTYEHISENVRVYTYHDVTPGEDRHELQEQCPQCEGWFRADEMKSIGEEKHCGGRKCEHAASAKNAIDMAEYFDN